MIAAEVPSQGDMLPQAGASPLDMLQSPERDVSGLVPPIEAHAADVVFGGLNVQFDHGGSAVISEESPLDVQRISGYVEAAFEAQGRSGHTASPDAGLDGPLPTAMPNPKPPLPPLPRRPPPTPTPRPGNPHPPLRPLPRPKPPPVPKPNPPTKSTN
jgi:outer membrane biosynthesis protein TonB